MMFVREAMVGFNDLGEVIVAGAGTEGFIDDSPETWKLLLKHRKSLVAIAHTHPGEGLPFPSGVDKTTFNVLSQAGFKHVDWWIVTSTHLAKFNSKGEALQALRFPDFFAPGTHDDWLDILCQLSLENPDVDKLVQSINSRR
jgi:proteasome lid subunit RPN8/RPN11